MAQIKISVKGKLEMTLTRNYNSLSVFTANKDDVGFNENVNPFYDYSLNSPCGSWTGDKIKILSLPDKGRLYYNSTPLSTPTYANVTVGQEIMVRDLIDYKVLRFSAEGSTDGQYTESYLTNFTFERYCISSSQNITVKVNLNMIDDKVADSKIYVTDALSINGNTSYKLHVENSPFIGYANTTGGKINMTDSIVTADYGETIYVPNNLEGQRVFSSSPVNIPIGVYDLNISATGMRRNSETQAVVNGEIGFGYIADFYAPASLNAIAYVEFVIE